jgi:putative tricarboxylic transport membrane protein
LFDVFISALTEIATTPELIELSLAGVLIGVILGALPGVSSTMALAILLPISYAMPTKAAMVFLIGVFSASVFGGSISAILVNIPGTPGAMVTQFDGYPMAQAGKAGEALSYALLASTIGGLIGLLILTIVAPLIASAAVQFRSPEFAMAAVFGLTMLGYASSDSTFRGVLVGCVGLLVGMVGFDTLTDVARFDFDTTFLQNGIDIVPLTVGVFGFAEVLIFLSTSGQTIARIPKIGRILPPPASLLRLIPTLFRGSLIGTFVGAVPAAGSVIAVALCYAQEQRLSRTPKQFGKGTPAGIVGPEAANNASVAGALVPTMTLGVPGDTMTAVLMGALLLHGLRPGPFLFVNNPEIVGVIYGSLFWAILLTLIFGFGAIAAIIQTMRMPRHILMVAIAMLCVFGSFASRHTMSDVYQMIFFGAVGSVLQKLRLPAAPLAFGLILGPLLEENVRRSLILSRGSWSVFVERPISLALIVLSVAALLYPLFGLWARRRRASDTAQ